LTGPVNYSSKIRSYGQSVPEFRLDGFFRGPSVATGIFQDRRGRVRNRFVMHLLGDWEGERGSLSERFLFLDDRGQATTAERLWQLRLEDDDHFIGTARGSAGDIVGEATGERLGYAMHWRYRVRQPVGDKFYTLSADDWMYLIDTDHVINRTRMFFLGFFIGEVSIEIHRLADTPDNRAAMERCPAPGEPIR